MRQQTNTPRLKHSLGQNFILDERVQAELADLSGVGKEDAVLEIGAGSGMLTRELASRCREVRAVEVDREMIPYLKAATLSCPNVRVIQGDALRLSLSEVTEGWEAFRIVANLPYHITSQLMTRLLKGGLPIRSIHCMLQKETALKLCAGRGEDGYGPLALRAQWMYDCEVLKVYPPKVFTPPPKVDSAFLAMVRRDAPPEEVSDEDALFRLITGVFAQRRKTMLNNLTASFQLTREDAQEVLTEAGLSETARADRTELKALVLLTERMLEKGWL